MDPRRVFYVVTAVSGLALGLAMPVRVLVLEARVGPSAAGVLLGVWAASTGLLEAPTGWVADRWGRRNALLVGAVLSAVGFAGIGLAESFAGLGVGVLAAAAGGALRSGALEAWFVDAAGDPDRPEVARALGRAEAFDNAGLAVGLAAAAGAAHLVDLPVGGARWLVFTPVLVAAAAALVAVAALTSVGVREPRRGAGAADAGWGAGMATLRATPLMSGAFRWYLAAGVATLVIEVLSSLRIVESMTSATAATVIAGCLGAGFAAGAFTPVLAERFVDRHGPITVAAVSTCAAAGAGLLAAGPWVWGPPAALVATWALSAPAVPLVNAAIHPHIPGVQRATVLSMLAAASIVPGGVVAAGLAWIDPRLGIVAAMAVLVLGAAELVAGAGAARRLTLEAG